MADNTIGNLDGTVNTFDGSDGGRDGRTTQTTRSEVVADYDSVQSMRDALKTEAPDTYDDATLNTMTRNDMLYALRLLRSPEAVN